MLVNEIFHSIQGEGKFIGLNTIFIRLLGCNLHCSWCDTPYAWDFTGKLGKKFNPRVEGHNLSTKEVMQEIEKYNSFSITISGGEPLLQQEAIAELVSQVSHLSHIETNGTIIPNAQLANRIDFWSVSPKLVSSSDPIEKRMNYNALYFFNQLSNSIFKFVIQNEEDFKEVLFLKDQIKISAPKIYLMAEGKTTQEQNDRAKSVIELCKEYGFNYSPRVDVLIYGLKRGV